MDSSLENAPRVIDGRVIYKREMCLVRDLTHFNHFAPRARKSKTTTKEKYEEWRIWGFEETEMLRCESVDYFLR